MNQSLHFQNLLETLKLINEISFNLNTKTYVWGGLTQDIYESKFLREHDDIDCLMMNRNKLDKKVEKLFMQKGWSVSDMNGVLSIKKDSNKIHMGNVETINNDLVKYTFYNGDVFISFPSTWLNKKPHSFYNLKVYTTTPEFKYAMRVYPIKLNPENEAREKDILPVEYFSKKLRKKYKNLNKLLDKMQFPQKLAEV